MTSDPVRLFPLAGGRRLHPEVERWFAQSPSELTRLARRWFDEIRASGPDVVDLLHDRYPTACVDGFALGYVAVFRAHVNVGFFLGTVLPDPDGLLEGTGRFMRHVKLRPGVRLDEAALTGLIAESYGQMKTRLAAQEGIGTPKQGRVG